MICPYCKEENRKSTLTSNGGIMSTLMGYVGYYDEDGKYHHHDNNTRTSVYECSNDHKFIYRSENSCWCGWKGMEEKFTLVK